jgi:putative sigma-54 modulation protein
MIVLIASRHMNVTAAMKDYAQTKASKLTKYYDRIQEIEVVFDPSGARGAARSGSRSGTKVSTAKADSPAKDQVGVEVIVHAEHRNMFVAHHAVGDAYACVDACCHKLERQLSEHKKKVRNRKHPKRKTTAKKSGILG